jgi:hypothetical protein
MAPAEKLGALKVLRWVALFTGARFTGARLAFRFRAGLVRDLLRLA